jgi:serine phosphatase RsbU (regulator of sigma subunit)/pSer/pThr/pTyr-binding forkhead associated (FHA) protein
MTTEISIPKATLEIVDAESTSQPVEIDAVPFRVGRGADADNNLKLDDRRISRRCLAVSYEQGRFFVEDIGQRNGVFINDQLVEGSGNIHSGDVITFGQVESFKLIFRAGPSHEVLPELLSRLERTDATEAGDRNLRHISLLLEATALLQAEMPMEEVLAAMVDRSIVITDADRGLLLMADPEGDLQPFVARQQKGEVLSPQTVSPSQTVITRAIEQKRGIVELDMDLAEDTLREAKSVVAQQLRSLVAIPLYSHSGLHAATTTAQTGELLGVLYLDSRRPAAFSSLERQILDALAVESTSVIENARLLERERERRKLEQELSIARDIQQALLPKGFQDFSHCQITAANEPCYAVGGDYFDSMALAPGQTGFILADVSGKGLPAALLTSMLQGCFAGMALGKTPTQLVNHINQFVWTRSETSRYATLFFGVLDSSGQLNYINAGHNSPLMVRGGKVSEPFPSGCVPLGLLSSMEFETCSASLEPGDTLVLFTDGVTEAVNRNDEEFEMDRLIGIVEQNAAASVEDLQNAVLDAVNDFARGAQQADDITLLVLRYQGAG